MIRILVAAGALAGLAAALSPVCAEEPAAVGKNAKVQISGVGWITYRYLLADEPARVSPAADMESTGRDAQDMNRFDVDRVYVTADYKMDERFSWQTVIEGRNLGGTASSRNLFLKRALVRVAEPFGLENTWVHMGIIPHVMTPVHERAWGMRIVSEVPIDRYLGVSTTWLGLGFGGTAGGMLDYEFALTNERPYNSDNVSKYKNLMARAVLSPFTGDETLKGLKLGLWAQGNSNLPEQPDTSGAIPNLRPAPSAGDNLNLWYGAFPHFVGDRYVIGLSFDQKSDDYPVIVDGQLDTDTRTAQVISAFVEVDPTAKLRLFGRIDRSDPNTDIDDNGLMNVNVGAAYRYLKAVRSIVDVEYTTYDEPETAGGSVELDADVTLSARLEISL